MKFTCFLICLCSVIIPVSNSFAQPFINHAGKKIIFGNSTIRLTLDYDKKASITFVEINGKPVIQGADGICSKIRTKEFASSTLQLNNAPLVKISTNQIQVSNIKYGYGKFKVGEVWTFVVSEKDIKFNIKRTLPIKITAEQVSFPVMTFNSINTWEGAYQDYGGLAWFYLFNRKRDTYGVYGNTSDFWNSKTGDGLTINVSSAGNHVAMDYSRTANDGLAYNVAVTPTEVRPRFDSGTHRRMYTRDTTDVWAPVTLNAGATDQTITFSYFDFNEKYGRGSLKGINGEQVSAVLNTIARIGVIGKQHFGGNSWHTPYGPICLHEQYIAQMGIGINDPNYLKGYKQCLDYYRDNAIRADGRVLSRWAYTNEDAMPNGFTDKGFYEAQWGYLMDANPDYVSNVAELYQQNGDINWVKTQQTACEKALDWILKRDSNKNGLVEMMTDSHLQKKGSDWIDIIWASYENAFVNAKLYHALVLWAVIEQQLNNTKKASAYMAFAEKLKDSFNKPTRNGGFWDEEKKCYVHWLNKDGSVHGNNMVIPINFMAIAYGICDDTARVHKILDDVQIQMEKERLFFWPICLYSYAPGEGNDWQFPFPNYENGDLFLSWGAIGVAAYAAYKPELALKYVKNVLGQYAKDGLAFQRYGRNKQDGLGDDILSGNSLAIVGLYQSIYGINPMHNRFYLNPHIVPELAGTRVRYNYKDQSLIISLDSNMNTVAGKQYRITAAGDFGFYAKPGELSYFHANATSPSMKIKTDNQTRLTLGINDWGNHKLSFFHSLDDMRKPVKISCAVNDCDPASYYTVQINRALNKIKPGNDGILRFEYTATTRLNEISVSW